MSRNRWLAAAAACALIATALATGTPPAAADARVVTVAGSLQSEVGCPGDWQPSCAASQLSDDGDGTYSRTFDLPAGSFEFKITINGSWDENYGAGGVRGGDNIPLVIAGPATLRFDYDDTTHIVTVSPTVLDPTVTAADRSLAGDSLRNRLTREQFYFVMTDRFANGDTTNDLGGYAGDKYTTGYDPTDKGYYHGGDLAGLRSQLEYIKALGTTSIWLTPSFVNRPVQGTPPNDSAGYHGYWITDFTQIDPHLGTNAELQTLIADAHTIGMKVFFDIITNHTADVIDYTEHQYTYLNKTDNPYTDVNGSEFDDRDYVNQPFPPMDASSFPYTPYFHSTADANAKSPAWLNNPIYYHNRGDSTFAGESSEYGDFVGLDDLFTERPEVEQGMEEIYKAWIDLGIDGFRIDTAKHVNIGFWQKFSPAMLQHAASVGTPNFFMFGEVYDANPTFQSIYSTVGTLPATLDFGFQQSAVAVTNGQRTTMLADLYAGDDYYTDADSNAYNLPTFLGNHDMGRIGNFVGGSLSKVDFANALMFTLRGQPVIYYGDEQGFIGDGGDKDARQDMFASQVVSYNDDPLVGGAPTGSRDRYGTDGVVFRDIAELSQLRASHRALQDGAQITRFASATAGVFAASRIDADEQIEYLVVANNSGTAKSATFATYTPNGKFRTIYGGGTSMSVGAEGQVTVSVPAMTVRVYRADRPIQHSKSAPAITLTSPAGNVLSGRTEVAAGVVANQLLQVTFAYRQVGASTWTPLGTDDNPTYRVFHDVSGFADGTLLEYRAIAKDNAGHISTAVGWGMVGTPPPPPPSGGVGDVVQPHFVSIPGTTNNEMGCAADWDPACDQAQLTLDPNDAIWKGTYPDPTREAEALPAGPYSYKVAIDKTWDENYGAGAVFKGANIEMTTDGSEITFFYDHRTHWVTSTAQGSIVVAPGSFQSEMGCGGDWDPACMRSWLQDPDGDGTFTLSTTQIPAGNYEGKVALNRSWGVNYGQGGVPNGANIPFTVPDGDVITNFSYNSTSHVMTVTISTAAQPPDITVAEALWIDDTTVAYPLDRLPDGVDQVWLRFRLHWGDLAVDATTLGGQSVGLSVAGTTDDGYVLLTLDKKTAKQIDEIRAAPIVAVGVYDDAGRLIDATGVG